MITPNGETMQGNKGASMGAVSVLFLHLGSDFIDVFRLQKLIALEKVHLWYCASLHILQ